MGNMFLLYYFYFCEVPLQRLTHDLILLKKQEGQKDTQGKNECVKGKKACISSSILNIWETFYKFQTKFVYVIKCLWKVPLHILSHLCGDRQAQRMTEQWILQGYILPGPTVKLLFDPRLNNLVCCILYLYVSMTPELQSLSLVWARGNISSDLTAGSLQDSTAAAKEHQVCRC